MNEDIETQIREFNQKLEEHQKTIFSSYFENINYLLFLVQYQISQAFYVSQKELLAAREYVSQTERFEKFVCLLCSRMDIRVASELEIREMKDRQMLYIEEK